MDRDLIDRIGIDQVRIDTLDRQKRKVIDHVIPRQERFRNLFRGAPGEEAHAPEVDAEKRNLTSQTVNPFK